MNLFLTANNGLYKSHCLHLNVIRNRKSEYQLPSSMQIIAPSGVAKAQSAILLAVNETSVPSDMLNITPMTMIVQIRKQSIRTKDAAQSSPLVSVNATLIPSDMLNMIPIRTIQELSSLQFDKLRLPSVSLEILGTLLNQVPSRLFDMNATAVLSDHSTTTLSSLQFDMLPLLSLSLERLGTLLNQVCTLLIGLQSVVPRESPIALSSAILNESQQVNKYKHIH